MKTVLVIRQMSSGSELQISITVFNNVLKKCCWKNFVTPLIDYILLYIHILYPSFFLNNNLESIFVAVRFPALFAIIHMLRPLSNKIQFTACIFKSRISVLNYFYTCIIAVRFFLALANW